MNAEPFTLPAGCVLVADGLHLGGAFRRYVLPNGYGASVVSHQHSYGGRNGLWELAVLLDGRLHYDSPITDDVIGHLREWQVSELLVEIAALPEVAK